MNPPSYAPSVIPSNQENEEMQQSETSCPVTHLQTLYMPIESPPTPAPSPGPVSNYPSTYPLGLASNRFLNTHDPVLRRQILASILMSCSPSELLFISTTVAPLLKRDFLFWLPTELSLHILSFIDDPTSLVRASMVSKHWYKLITEEYVWRWMCRTHGYEDFDEYLVTRREKDVFPVWKEEFSYREHYKLSHITMANWRKGGSLLQSHSIPVTSPDNGVVTSLALDNDWIVIGLAGSKVHVFDAKTGALARTLVGHETGVWAICLVSKGGYPVRPPQHDNFRKKRKGDVESLGFGIERLDITKTQEQYISPVLRTVLGLDEDDSYSNNSWKDQPQSQAFPGKRSDNFTSQGWGQPDALVVSGGCDKVIRVWDVKTGYVFLVYFRLHGEVHFSYRLCRYCVYTLNGHTSTVRCIRVLHNRPIAVSGSRDGTVRIWDIQRGRALRVLQGHRQSVRCLDVCGNRIVSGSYDTTCRVSDEPQVIVDS